MNAASALLGGMDETMAGAESCRMKIRPKARTWFRGSKLHYQQLFCLLMAWQTRQSPGSVRLAPGLSYKLYYHPAAGMLAFASTCRQTAANCSLAWLRCR